MSQQGMRTFSTEFKEAVVLRLEAGERIAAVAEELKIKRKLALRVAGGLSQAWGSRAEPEARS
jgi:transposase-like protein